MKKIFLFAAAALLSVSMFADNISCADAIARIDKGETGECTVQGYVISIYEYCNPTYKNTTLWLADDPKADKGTFEVYRLPVDITKPAEIPVPGDKIAVTAQLTKYGSTYETKDKTIKGYEILEKGTATRYTEDDMVIGQVNVADAIAAGMKLKGGETSYKTYEVTGYLVSIAKDGSFKDKKMSFYMDDDATKDKGDFEAYKVKIQEEAKKGDKVKVVGNLQRYDGEKGTTIEIAFGTAEIVEKAQGIENVSFQGAKAMKVMENGQLYIIRNGVKYNAAGAVVE